MARKKARWVTLLNYFMFCIFLLAVVVQYNDTDAAIWMFAYGVATVACLLWRWPGISRFWYMLIGGVCIAWGLYLLIINGDQLSWEGMFSSIQMKNESVEVIREVGGLFIITIWMSVLSFFKPNAVN